MIPIQLKSGTNAVLPISPQYSPLSPSPSHLAAATLSHTLWAGTNSGQILVFLLHVPAGDKRASDKASTILAKEIQLKHRAPVISIDVIDAAGLPVDGEEAGQQRGGKYTSFWGL